MRNILECLARHPHVSDYKINVHHKESYELFYVKGKLETVRRTATCDREVTVYADHDGFRGDAQFFVYPSTTQAQLEEQVDEAVRKALLINNKMYTLPEKETGEYQVESNFSHFAAPELAERIANTVFSANEVEHAALNSVEIFINKHTETVANSKGLNKTQTRYDAMVEAIPTYNGAAQSVELYQEYSFSHFDEAVCRKEIAAKLHEVKARYEAIRPDFAIQCPVILGHQEIGYLFYSILEDLNYASVYAQANLFKKGDLIQKEARGDLITLTMAGECQNSTHSAKFDQDGLSLASVRVVEQGQVTNYYGSNRYGQYLGETPTGNLRCIMAEPGSGEDALFTQGPVLEVMSMSGLQVDFFNDYIGGEIRLAYYNDGQQTLPVTGISISGKLSEVLNHIRFSRAMISGNDYQGPEKAYIPCMQIF